MKILAEAANKTFIVEMSSEEIARAAGYPSDYADAWAKANGGRTPKVGTRIDVNATYTFHARLVTKQHEARNGAAILRALAEMLENGLPDVIAPPVETAPAPEGEAV